MSQKCIGYDFVEREVFYEKEIQHTDGTTETVYTAYDMDTNAELWSLKSKPHIPNPIGGYNDDSQDFT